MLTRRVWHDIFFNTALVIFVEEPAIKPGANNVHIFGLDDEERP